jgi:sorbose reductase
MTDMTLELADKEPELSSIFVNRPPIGRMGDRKDLKGAAVFLLSDASAYMTGAETLITGGLHGGRIASNPAKL